MWRKLPKEASLTHQGTRLLKRSIRCAATTSSILGVCVLRRTCNGTASGQSIGRFTTSVVCRSHGEEGPGKNWPFSVENKWQLLIMMTMYFGSGFASPYLVVTR